MANVQAARKMLELGYDFIPGMKVSWIVTDSKSAPMKVEPYVSGSQFTAKPDYRYYAERLAKMAGTITDVLGWGEKDLMMGSQQATLLDGGMFSSKESDAPQREPPKAPKPKPKVRSLDEFFRGRTILGRSVSPIIARVSSAIDSGGSAIPLSSQSVSHAIIPPRWYSLR